MQLGGRLFHLDPTQPDPSVGVVHLARIDGDTLRFTRTPGYGSFGERLEYHRDNDGAVMSVRGGSGTTAYPIDKLIAALETRERITVGDLLRPGD